MGVVARTRHGADSGSGAPWDPEPNGTPGPSEVEATEETGDDGEQPEGPSLRERLARAAAARHRGALR